MAAEASEREPGGLDRVSRPLFPLYAACQGTLRRIRPEQAANFEKILWGRPRLVDHVKPEKRSQMMAAVRSKDTKPEMAVRRLVHSMGFRYRLHQASLPGKPDLVFASRRKIILVHGCFWHRHRGCRYTTTPKTRTAFWNQKFCANMERDRLTLRTLKRMGWSVKTVWQCELKNQPKLAKVLNEFLSI